MKILFLEDHTFFAKEIIQYINMFLNKNKDVEIRYAHTFREAEEIVRNEVFDHAILDVQLQNGHNGIEFADKNKEKIGKILFITGCCEPQILETLDEKKYQYLRKHSLLWEPLKKFLNAT